MSKTDELTVNQRAFIERSTSVIETYSLNGAKSRRRDAVMLTCLTTAAFLLSLPFFGFDTPLWGNLIGAAIGGFVVFLVTHSRSQPKFLSEKSPPLVLTSKGVISPDGHCLNFNQIDDVQLKKSVLHVKASGFSQDFSVVGLNNPESAFSAIESARAC